MSNEIEDKDEQTSLKHGLGKHCTNRKECGLYTAGSAFDLYSDLMIGVHQNESMVFSSLYYSCFLSKLSHKSRGLNELVANLKACVPSFISDSLQGFKPLTAASLSCGFSHFPNKPCGFACFIVSLVGWILHQRSQESSPPASVGAGIRAS